VIYSALDDPEDRRHEVSMNITIRHALQSDIPAIIRFNSAIASETENKTLEPEAIKRGVSALFDDPGKGFYIVAEDGGTPVGCLLITYEWSDWRNSYFWWIQSVFVLPEYRRRGIYTMLHGFIEDVARGHADVRGIRLYVDKDNLRAQHVYRTLGMSPARYDMFEKEW
jgi:GNAT superfamily N-acetyltransferase